MTTVRSILAALVLASPAAARGASARLPDARALLVAALSAPATGYEARGRIQSFAPGRKPKALGMTIYFLPDGRLRREVRASPRRPPDQVFIDDGSRQELYWPRLGTLWKGSSAREAAAERAARLRSLYAISVSAGGKVAKRETWRLSFRSPDGSLRRALWVDRADGLLLKCEEYRLDGSLLRRERLTVLKAGSPDPRLFRLDVPPGTAAASMTAPRGPARPGAIYPRWIPDGFLALESSVEGPALTVGYGDGVESFTLREEPGGEVPDGREKSGRPVRLAGGGRAALLPGADGPLLLFRSRGLDFSITGEITEDEMVRVADSLAGERR
ncbi:MAG TPA: hypothetical protein VH309_13725 [Elusimicrobiota bacterium]|jgi:hypothetical protein|nr:hypothetical protein [Elusimicrobiota bacterium]